MNYFTYKKRTKKFKDMSYEMTCFYIKNKPKVYIGLNPDWYNQGFIELLSIKKFTYWPDKNSIQNLLPIPFRYRYSDVQSIIDCLEIEIPKPSNPIEQSLTWSDYKKCNTLKYLISSTPDGFINFISEGYGGRSSDVLLVKKSGYLECLPENCTVMADRGLKKEVLETKRIASLRIHIERVIGRLREFKTLKPHVLMHLSLVSNVDDIITIACALIN
ncbi:Uncharacterized protein FWK35_00035585, partial [Aphis craccivora]